MPNKNNINTSTYDNIKELIANDKLMEASKLIPTMQRNELYGANATTPSLLNLAIEKAETPGGLKLIQQLLLRLPSLRFGLHYTDKTGTWVGISPIYQITQSHFPTELKWQLYLLFARYPDTQPQSNPQKYQHLTVTARHGQPAKFTKTMRTDLMLRDIIEEEAHPCKGLMTLAAINTEPFFVPSTKDPKYNQAEFFTWRSPKYQWEKTASVTPTIRKEGDEEMAAVLSTQYGNFFDSTGLAVRYPDVVAERIKNGLKSEYLPPSIRSLHELAQMTRSQLSLTSGGHENKLTFAGQIIHLVTQKIGEINCSLQLKYMIAASIYGLAEQSNAARWRRLLPKSKNTRCCQLFKALADTCENKAVELQSSTSENMGALFIPRPENITDLDGKDWGYDREMIQTILKI